MLTRYAPLGFECLIFWGNLFALCLMSLAATPLQMENVVVIVIGALLLSSIRQAIAWLAPPSQLLTVLLVIIIYAGTILIVTTEWVLLDVLYAIGLMWVCCALFFPRPNTSTSQHTAQTTD